MKTTAAMPWGDSFGMRRGRSMLAATVPAVLLLAGCRGEGGGRTSTTLPTVAGASAARAALDSLPPVPAPALSRFDIPLRYDFSPVLDVVERNVPTRFGSLDNIHTVGGDDHKHYAFQATRGPFTVFARDTLIHLRATLSYMARGFYKPPIGPTLSAGCGDDEQRPRIVVELVTPMTLSPQWHLVSHTRVGRLAPASASDRDRCTVSVINYDVTDQVVDAARSALASRTSAIDAKIGAVDLTGRFTDWWGLLNRPIHLADSVWLLLAPERLRVGTVSGDGTQLLVQAGLDAHPRIVTGPEPHVNVPPLPPLARDTLANGFHVSLEGVVGYAMASSTITEALRGRTVSEAGHTVAIRTVRVSPLPGGRLALAVDFTGDANGTLVFNGTPRYEPRAGQLAVPDLDYDLETDSKLVSAYTWLRGDALRTVFREKARIPVRPLLDRGRALLVDGLNRKLGDAVTLSASVDSVAVAGLYVTRDGVVVRALAAGHAAMGVQQH